jgi:hypothetical protein
MAQSRLLPMAIFRLSAAKGLTRIKAGPELGASNEVASVCRIDDAGDPVEMD